MKKPDQDSHVIVLVELDRKVPGHVPAAVVVPVVLHEVVHVVEDQAVPVQVFHGLLEAHVEQHRSIERLGAALETEGRAAQLRGSLCTGCDCETQVRNTVMGSRTTDKMLFVCVPAR